MAIEIHGHRGARGLAPENTLPGFAAALAIGVDAIELDVLTTADGTMVVTHDRALSPTLTRDAHGAWLDARGPLIRSLTLAELARYDVGRIRPGSALAAEYPEQRGRDGVRIPTLEDVIALVRAAGNERVRLIVEVKTSPEEPEATLPPRGFAERLIETLRRLAFDRAVIHSFDWRVLEHARAIAPEIPRSHLTVRKLWMDTLGVGSGGGSPWTAGRDVRASLPRAVHEAGGAMWAPHYRDLTRAACDEARALGLEVLVWTVNDPAEMRAMVRRGVTGIVTDYPDRLRRVLVELGRPVPAATPVEPAAHPEIGRGDAPTRPA